MTEIIFKSQVKIFFPFKQIHCNNYIKKIKLEKSIEHYKKIIGSKQSFLKYIDAELYSFIVDNFNY